MERDLAPRKKFEELMKEGIRPAIYYMVRLAGGEYVSPFTEQAWKYYRDGWNAAVKECCE